MIRVALSFDNGPEPEVTPRVLDVLAARDIRATFFVLGAKIATGEGKAIVLRAAAEGHVVGNHSYTHEIPLGDDPRPDAAEREIGETERLLDRLFPRARRLFRPFGGGGKIGRHLLSTAAVRYLTTHGYTCVLWNDVPHDWDDPQGWAERAIGGCVEGAHVSLVLHDLPNACLAGLPRFLDSARERGVAFVTEQPPACLPIVDGKPTLDLAPFTRA